MELLMTERELLDTDLLTKCDREDCPVCQIKASTMELLLEEDCE